MLINKRSDFYNMRDRVIPCIYYTNAHGECQKGRKDVTMDKCKNCSKYRPRKIGRRMETVKEKRRKDRERHDKWD